MATQGVMASEVVVLTRYIGILWFQHQKGFTLQWRQTERDSASNRQPHDCLLTRLVRRRSKKTPKLRVAGLCEGNSPVAGEFPAQRASKAEKDSIWLHHPEMMISNYSLWRANMLNGTPTHFVARVCISWHHVYIHIHILHMINILINAI